MQKKIIKLYKGQIDLRDYEVEKCIAKKENFLVIHNNQRMLLTCEELISKRISISDQYTGRNGKVYRLYGYVWNPK